jgi:hypothetical protein
MGGLGSGRSGGRPTTDSGLTLALSKLLRDRLFRPGSFRSGSLIWTNTTTDEQVGSLGYEAHLGEDNGRVRLHFTTTRQVEKSTVPIAGSSSKQPRNPSAADGGSYAPARARGRRNSTCPTVPSPSHRAKPTGSHTPANANPPMSGLHGVLSSCGASSEGQAASKATSPNPSGCARQPTTASSKKSSPPRRSSTRICWGSSRSSSV